MRASQKRSQKRSKAHRFGNIQKAIFIWFKYATTFFVKLTSLNSKQTFFSKALAGCNAWIDECQRMTSLFWRNDMYHPWKGEPFQSLNVLKLRDRINNVIVLLINHTFV